LRSSAKPLRTLVRGDLPDLAGRRVSTEGRQVTVVDLHNLPERAQRFVVGVVLASETARKEASGTAGLLFTMIDELNKYAPREGSSPIKEVLLDIAERGRSLGIILIGAQQTASEVERRIVSNSSVKVVGRLDPAEAGRPEYGFLRPPSAAAPSWRSPARCRSRCRWPSSSRSPPGRRGCPSPPVSRTRRATGWRPAGTRSPAYPRLAGRGRRAVLSRLPAQLAVGDAVGERRPFASREGQVRAGWVSRVAHVHLVAAETDLDAVGTLCAPGNYPKTRRLDALPPTGPPGNRTSP
jgi:hypothetical protein